MKVIQVLDEHTIDKIAAGEVIERPASIVKELVENAIDAGANAVTVEIKEGGTTFIRITDNGEGIEKAQVPTAFLRHATSKIRKVEDLLSVSSLGFRGEALSSIAAVSQVELITKTAGTLTGTRYVIEGGKEVELEEIGAPEGTTFLVNNLFYNTPARKKFLKSPMTEAGYIGDLMDRMALSHPEVAFKFITNGKTKLHTSGNTNLKDIIYGVYGRDIASNLTAVSCKTAWGTIEGFAGKPVISRGNRNFENYFINGRYVKSNIITKAIEDAYKTFMMQHKYPFTALHLTIDGKLLDVNVHPAKMELRFSNQEEMYESVYRAVKDSLTKRELIPEVQMERPSRKEAVPPMKTVVKDALPEPFQIFNPGLVKETPSYQKSQMSRPLPKAFQKPELEKVQKPEVKAESEHKVEPVVEKLIPDLKPVSTRQTKQAEVLSNETKTELPQPQEQKPEQLDLFEGKLLTKENVPNHKIIGQLFDTYWLVEFEEKLYIIDQHAAHEKVLYERTMKGMQNRQYTSQHISPPVILSLGMREEETLKEYQKTFESLGFEIEHFGGKEYALCAVPDNLFGIEQENLFVEMLDGLTEQGSRNVSTESILEKVASMSCKAAVKGNHRLSVMEAKALIDELLTLENPYNCPHGRPTIISMTKQELEKKFKRIVS